MELCVQLQLSAANFHQTFSEIGGQVGSSLASWVLCTEKMGMQSYQLLNSRSSDVELFEDSELGPFEFPRGEIPPLMKFLICHGILPCCRLARRESTINPPKSAFWHVTRSKSDVTLVVSVSAAEAASPDRSPGRAPADPRLGSRFYLSVIFDSAGMTNEAGDGRRHAWCFATPLLAPPQTSRRRANDRHLPHP